MFIFHMRPELLAVADRERLGLLCTGFVRYTGVKIHPDLSLILFLHFLFTWAFERVRLFAGQNPTQKFNRPASWCSGQRF
jgi:hypothetical protein